MASLTGKVALVTGASRGIGRAIAQRLAMDGAVVAVNYTQRADLAQQVVTEITTHGGQAQAFRADISRVVEIRRLFQEMQEHFGGLDILINNAGLSILKPHVEITEDEFDRLFALNAKGTFFALQEAARWMREHGRIVSISSGRTVQGGANGGAYAGSKAAIEQFSLALMKELGVRGITVNTVLPSITKTEGLVLPAPVIDQLVKASPFGRLAEPQDIADVVAFLVSDQAHWITGQSIRATGGMV